MSYEPDLLYFGFLYPIIEIRVQPYYRTAVKNQAVLCASCFYQMDDQVSEIQTNGVGCNRVVRFVGEAR